MYLWSRIKLVVLLVKVLLALKSQANANKAMLLNPSAWLTAPDFMEYAIEDSTSPSQWWESRTKDRTTPQTAATNSNKAQLLRVGDEDATANQTELLKNLPGASFWLPENPNARPSIFITTKTPTVNIGIKQAVRVTALPNAVPVGSTTMYSANIKPAVTKSAVTNIAVTNAATQHTQQNNVGRGNYQYMDYEYKPPSWEGIEIPTFVKTTSNVTTTITTPTPPTTPSFLQKAKKRMAAHQMDYLSGFVTSLCEIIMNNKGNSFPKALAGNFETVVTEYIRDGKLANLKPQTLRAVEEYTAFMNQVPPKIMNDLAIIGYAAFSNHSFFLNDTQKILKEVESWYTEEEGEELIKSLEDVNDYPQTRKHDLLTLVRKAMVTLMKPYYRPGNTDRRDTAIAEVEQAISIRNIVLRSIDDAGENDIRKRLRKSGSDGCNVNRFKYKMKRIMGREDNAEKFTRISQIMGKIKDTPNIHKINNPNDETSIYLTLKSAKTSVREKIRQKFFDNFKSDRSVMTLTEKNVLANVKDESSYSDAEKDLKFNLDDAVRHNNVEIFKNGRKSFTIKEKMVNDLTSESDEEGIFKSNIYRAFSYNLDVNKLSKG